MKKTRIAAYIIDEILVFAIIIMVLLTLLMLDQSISDNDVFGVSVFLNWLYIFGCDWQFRGITVGKKLMGVKMYFDDRNPPYMKIAAVHGIWHVLFTVFGAFFLWCIFSENRRMPYEKWFHIRIE